MARSLLSSLLVVGTLVLPVCGPAKASDGYPNRTVRFVVGYPAGGSGDILARILAERMSSAFGHPVVVENRAGASGAIGAQTVANSAPDGHTVLIGQLGEIVINPHWVSNPGYDAANDLVPVAMAGVLPLALVAPNKASYSSLPEMLKVSKTRTLTFASPGVGTPGHFAGEVLKLKTGGQFQHVPYKGAGPALNDLVGGHVDLNFAGFPAAAPLVQSKAIKLLAVTSSKRSIAAPDVPTVAEAGGISDYDVAVWVGLFVPKGTPRSIVNKLHSTVNEVEKQSEVRSKLLQIGAEVSPMSIQQFGEFVKAESNKYLRIIQDANLKAQ